MAINSAYIVHPSVSTEVDKYHTVVPRVIPITESPLDMPSTITNTDGTYSFIIYNPVKAGQLIYYKNADVGQLYCSIPEQVTGQGYDYIRYRWVPCVYTIAPIDARTGKPYDPNLVFYSPLAK